MAEGVTIVGWLIQPLINFFLKVVTGRGQIRLEIEHVSADIYRYEPHASVVIISATKDGDLEVNCGGAMYLDGDSAVGLSAVCLVFKRGKEDAFVLPPDYVQFYPEGKNNQGEFSGRVSLPPKRWVPWYVQGAVDPQEFKKLEDCDALYLRATVGAKKAKDWHVGKRDGKRWVKV